jgi:hypothetical protein
MFPGSAANCEQRREGEGRAAGKQAKPLSFSNMLVHITLRVNLEGTHVGAINLDVLFVVRLIIVVLWSDVAAQDTAST